MASAFSLVKSRSLYLVTGPMWQKFILLTIAHYSKIDWPIPLFGPRSSPFMSSDVIFLQAKWSKIKERVKGWKSGKKTWFKRITVCYVDNAYMYLISLQCLPQVFMTAATPFEVSGLKTMQTTGTLSYRKCAWDVTIKPEVLEYLKICSHE